MGERTQNRVKMHSETSWRFPLAAPPSVSPVLKSLVVWLIIELIQIKLSESLTATPVARSSPPSRELALEDSIVLDPSSLYATSAHQIYANQHKRHKRAAGVAGHSKSVDACQSRMEILTPYHATNSKGKLRTVVNSELMQQAIQVETCVRQAATSTNAGRCNAQPECGCEQKYKWHRLLVLDPADEHAADSSSGAHSKGLFMDWFLFPSNCVCRCKTRDSANTRLAFLRSISAPARHSN